MPGRKVPLICGEFYHVFNRGIDHRSTFIFENDYRRALETIWLYCYAKPPMCLSKFLRLNDKTKLEVRKSMVGVKPQVSLIAYCLMPNHFHFLVRQDEPIGISRFIGNFQNSYTKYFNTRHERDGSLYLDQFKAVRVETEEQLLHTSRYIHLNPYSNHLVSSLSGLASYPWSSLSEYLDGEKGLVDQSFILKDDGNLRIYRDFVMDHADYQRKLKEIEHLLIE